MFVMTFICKELKKGTCPCCEGSDVAEQLGIPKDQQECFCGRFIKDLPRNRGIPKYHTCIRQLGDAGRMYVTQDEPDTLRIEVRLKDQFDRASCYKAIRYLEARHPGTSTRLENEGGSPVSLRFEVPKTSIVVEPPPRNEEEATIEKLEPRPQGVAPEDLARMVYRGPLPEPGKGD